MNNSQDISSQVMIEVGLALSMAFFSLFVLVLISLNAEKLSQLSGNQVQTPNTSIQMAIQDKNRKTSNTPLSEQLHKTLYIFYKSGQFYDELLNRVDVNQLPFDVPIVVAAPNNLPLIALISLQEEINHPNASITNLTEDWIKAMEQLP